MNKFKSLVGALALVSSASAYAILPPVDPVAGYGGASYNFTCLVGCDDTPDIGSQLFLQVLHDIDPSDGVDSNVYFKFFNIVGVPSSVEQVSVDGLSGFGAPGGAGTNFEAANSPNPKNLPGGNTATPPFDEDYTFEAIPNPQGGFPGKPAAGIDGPLDTLEFARMATNYDAIVAGIASGDIRFGLHVIAFANGGSATYINNPVPVPEPETWAMLATGLLLVGTGIARNRKR